jgi:hypothetical protein
MPFDVHCEKNYLYVHYLLNDHQHLDLDNTQKN